MCCRLTFESRSCGARLEWWLQPTPKAPAGSYDAEAAKRGQVVFNGTAECSTYHVPPIFTEPGYSLHTAEEIGIDSFQADRGPDRRYVTTPLRGPCSTHRRFTRAASTRRPVPDPRGGRRPLRQPLESQADWRTEVS